MTAPLEQAARVIRDLFNAEDMAACMALAQALADAGLLSQSGWVMVPKEPTEAMIEAAIEAASFYVHTYEAGQTPVEPVSAIVYRAMLAASPPPQAVGGPDE